MLLELLDAARDLRTVPVDEACATIGEAPRSAQCAGSDAAHPDGGLPRSPPRPDGPPPSDPLAGSWTGPRAGAIFWDPTFRTCCCTDLHTRTSSLATTSGWRSTRNRSVGIPASSCSPPEQSGRRTWERPQACTGSDHRGRAAGIDLDEAFACAAAPGSGQLGDIARRSAEVSRAITLQKALDDWRSIVPVTTVETSPGPDVGQPALDVDPAVALDAAALAGDVGVRQPTDADEPLGESGISRAGDRVLTEVASIGVEGADLDVLAEVLGLPAHTGRGVATLAPAYAGDSVAQANPLPQNATPPTQPGPLSSTRRSGTSSRIKGVDGDDVSADLVGTGAGAAQWQRREQILRDGSRGPDGCAFPARPPRECRGSTADQPRVGRAKVG